VDVQPELVHQIVAQEGGREVGAADHHLALQRVEVRGMELAAERGVPGDLRQRPRVDDLRCVAPDTGELPDEPGRLGILVGVRPEPGHQLVVATPVDERGRPRQDLVEVGVQLFVDRVPRQIITGSGEVPVDRHRHLKDDP
jgi:hypothetical protein